jgi:hypothetical protein
LERDVENEAGAQEEVLKLGFLTLPITVIEGRAITGFNPKQLAEALHSATKVILRDPSETLPIIARALEAVERAVRQIPDERLDWSVPGRKRPMRELACHIFMHARSAMSGHGATLPTTASAVDASSYATFKAIADYGHAISEEYRSWASKQDLDALRQLPPAGPNARSGSERLDLAAGQIIQHLRQIYYVLEDSGITPMERVPDSAWPQEYVLTILW